MINNMNALDLDERKFLNAGEDFAVVHASNNKYAKTSMHSHAFFEISVILSGKALFTMENGCYHLQPGDVTFTPPYALHQIQLEEGVQCERLILWVTGPYVRRLSSEKTDLLERTMAIYKNGYFLARDAAFFASMQRLIKKLEECSKGELYGKDLVIDGGIRSIFIAINRRSIEGNYPIVEPLGNVDVQAAVSYINNNLGGDLSLKAIAEKVGKSEYYLSHLFKETIHISIHQYVVKNRLNYSRLLLGKCNDISEVCRLSGFGDASHFIQAFRKEYGTTPYKYIQDIKTNR